MTNKPTRRYQLDSDTIKTIEDVKKILNLMQLRLDTDNPIYEEVKDYFKLEVVPKGYLLLANKIGFENIAKLNYEEIEQQCAEILRGNIDYEETD